MEFAQLFFPFILTSVGKAFWELLSCLTHWSLGYFSHTKIWCQWQREVPSLGLTMEAKVYQNQPENNQVSCLLEEVRPFVSMLHFTHLSCLGTIITNFFFLKCSEKCFSSTLAAENPEKLGTWETMGKAKEKQKKNSITDRTTYFLKYLIPAVIQFINNY